MTACCRRSALAFTWSSGVKFISKFKSTDSMRAMLTAMASFMGSFMSRRDMGNSVFSFSRRLKSRSELVSFDRRFVSRVMIERCLLSAG